MRRPNSFLLFLCVFLIIWATTGCGQPEPNLVTIRILHWNDFHSSNAPREIESEGGRYLRGGAAILASALKKLSDNSLPTVTVHAGDELQGTPVSALTRGASQIRLLNLLRPDIFTPGNHDFDYGRFRLDSLLTEAHFTVISANLFDNSAGKLLFQPYEILRTGESRIGFIGLMTPEFSRIVLRDRIQGLSVLDPVKTVRHYWHQLRDSVDIVVVVSHMGIEEDEKLAQAVPEIDLIIGGHSHTVLERPRYVNGVPIVQAGSYGRFLGEIVLRIDTEGDSVVDLSEKLHPLNSRYFDPDPMVQQVVDSLEAIVAADLDEVIAILKTDWVRNRQGESNIGNWITDALRSYTGADVAFQNSGGIRKNLRSGAIRKRDFWEIAPFGNQVVVFSVSGTELRKILEKSVSGEGSVLQGSGFRVVFDPKAPRGQRVQKITVSGKPLDESKTYRVATNYFVFDHFYEQLGIPPNDLSKRDVKILNVTVRDVLIEMALRQKEISSFVEGRYTQIEQ